jgi:hypothetical protein
VRGEVTSHEIPTSNPPPVVGTGRTQQQRPFLPRSQSRASPPFAPSIITSRSPVAASRRESWRGASASTGRGGAPFGPVVRSDALLVANRSTRPGGGTPSRRRPGGVGVLRERARDSVSWMVFVGSASAAAFTSGNQAGNAPSRTTRNVSSNPRVNDAGSDAPTHPRGVGSCERRRWRGWCRLAAVAEPVPSCPVFQYNGRAGGAPPYIPCSVERVDVLPDGSAIADLS